MSKNTTEVKAGSEPPRTRWWAGQFPFLLGSQVLVTMGDHLMSLTVTVVIFKLFGTGAALGTYFVCRAAPAVLLGPLAGVFVDRYNRRTVAALACCLSIVVAALLPQVQSAVLLLAGVFLVATAGAVTGPALQATLPQVVAKDKLLTANSTISGTGTVSRLVGPAVSALLVSVYGSQAGFYAAATAYFLAFVALLLLKLPSPVGKAEKFDFKGFLSFLGGGLRYLSTSPLALWITLVITVVLFADSCVAPLFTLLLQHELGTPPEFIGYLSTSFGAGTLLGSILLPILGRKIKEDRLLGLGTLLVGLQMVAYSLIPAFSLALPLQVISGCGFAMVLNTVRTIFQKVVPNEVIGRVVAGAMALSAFLNLFAFKAGGLVADVAGVRSVFLVAGVLSVAIGLAAFYFVNLTKLEKSAAGQAPSA
jgi:DHA3 family macrolide efflux protein-like MFS transporter